MMTLLLDTSAILAHLRHEPGAERLQKLFAVDMVTFLLCSVSLAELAMRLRALGASPAEASDTIEAYLQLVDEVAPVDDDVALEADRLSQAAGAELPLVDALIAAAAKQHRAILVHCNPRFQLLPENLVPQINLIESSGGAAG